jgi:hypothetical protein
LNQASIAIGKLAGTETVTRRVKNVEHIEGDVQADRERAWFRRASQANAADAFTGTRKERFTITFTARRRHWAPGRRVRSSGEQHSHGPEPHRAPAVAVSALVRFMSMPFGASEVAAYQVTAGFTGNAEHLGGRAHRGYATPDSVVTGAFDINARRGQRHQGIHRPLSRGQRLPVQPRLRHDNGRPRLFVYLQTPRAGGIRGHVGVGFGG